MDAPEACDTQQPFYGERELRQVAAVVEQRYAYVGGTEDLHTSLCVLERLYPVLLRDLCAMPEPHVHETAPRTFSPTESDLQLLREWNAQDSQLYRRVVQLHVKRALAFGLTSSLAPPL